MQTLETRLKDDKFYKETDTRHLKNLAISIGVDISDIKYKGNYKRKLRKRILEVARDIESLKINRPKLRR